MKRKVLVSLVSDQTIPNVQLIKEFDKEVDVFLFISTEGMETNGNRIWIINACKIKEDRLLDTIIVNQHSFDDIEEKLGEAKLTADDDYIINITCGTKVMSLVCYDFFNKLGAEVYYVTGFNNEYIKVFPKRKRQNLLLQNYVNLDEYLTSYGFNIEPSKISSAEEVTINFFNYFINEITDQELKILNQIRAYRSKKLEISKIDGLQNLLSKLNLPFGNDGKLSKKENCYLSGDWFEEYVYFKVKNDLNLEDDKIGIGYNLTKKGVPNEFDVLFMYDNRVFTIECKTSIFARDAEGKEKSFIGEVLYKSDSLQKEFGLFTTTSIFTLSNLVDDKGKLLSNLTEHYKRAEMNRIKVVSKTDLTSDKNIKDILKLK